MKLKNILRNRWPHSIPVRESLVALACGFLLFFWRQWLIMGWLPLNGDLLRFYYPSWVIGKDMLTAGGDLLWDSFRGMGQPYLANPSNQGLYPLRLLSLILNFAWYERIYIAFHVGLMSIFGYLFVKKWTSETIPSVAAVLGMSFSGFFFFRVGYSADFASMAWIPCAFYCLYTGRSMALGGVLGLQWMAGFPPFSILTGVALLIWCLLQKNRRRSLQVFLTGGLWALGLSAVQFLPFIELLRESVRPLIINSPDIDHSVSIWTGIRQLLYPACFFNLQNISTLERFYMGPILLAATIWGAWKGSKDIRLLFIVALGFLALSTGFPFPNLFRFHSHWLVLFVFFSSLVAAKGIQALPNRSIQLGFVALIALDLLFLTRPNQSPFANPLFYTQTPTRLASFKNVRPTERLFHSGHITDRIHLWPMNSLETMGLIKGLMVPSFGAAYGYREVVSHNNLTTRRNEAYKKSLNAAEATSPLFDYAGVRVIVALTKEGSAKLAPSPDDCGSIINPDPKPRAFMSHNSTPVKIVSEQSGDIILEAVGPGTVVLSESWYPGWMVSVEGRNSRPSRFEEYFLSTEVGSGPHKIRFYYRPLSVRIGLGISVMTFLVMLGMAVKKLRTREQI